MPAKTTLKHLVICFLTVICLLESQSKNYPITPVSFINVKVNDEFWALRLKINKEVTIPIAFKKAEETGRIDNFRIAGRLMKGKFRTEYPFDDSDIYKNIEAASYSLQIMPDPALEAYVDTLISYIAAAQEPDGYLYTCRTIDPLHPHKWSGLKRWEYEDVLSHEALQRRSFIRIGSSILSSDRETQVSGYSASECKSCG